MPWTIGAILCINNLTADFITVGCLALSMIMYFIFNVREHCKNFKFACVLFMIPSLGTFASFYIGNFAMSNWKK